MSTSRLNLLIVATIVLGLYVDQHLPYIGQGIVSLAAWLLFAVIFVRADVESRMNMAICLVFATLGEVVLSLVWGLYDYRLHNIPWFVPPGHVLLFLLGTNLAQRLPQAIAWAVPALTLPAVIYLAAVGADHLSLGLFVMFLGCIVFGPSRRLYATMFVLALLMELYGTWLGNWTWRPQAPLLQWATVNPPLAAGAFYCVLDLLVLSSRRYLRPLRYE